MSENSAVAHAGGKNHFTINRVVLAHVVDQGGDKTEVVYVLALCRNVLNTTAIVPTFADAFGISHEKALVVGKFAELAFPLGVSRCTTATMKHEHQRQGLVLRQIGGHMQVIDAIQFTDPDHPLDGFAL